MGTISIGDMSAFDGPKYRAVADGIRNAVGQGQLTDGDRLPPVRDLAWELKITPGTVARAYSLLTDEGLLVAEVGRGTFVAASADAPLSEAPLTRTPARNTEIVPLFSPRLPDVGQDDLIRRLLRAVADNPGSDLLNYPTRAGTDAARRAAAAWLEDAHLGAIDHRDMVLTNGGQNGISLIMQCVLRGPRPVVMVEELCYPGFRHAAELLRAEVVPVPMDRKGILPEALDRLAAEHGPQLLCTSPEVQNPTGVRTTLERRHEIARIAAARGFDILEDDCYRLSQSELPGYRVLVPRHCWFVSSISKTLTPGLRIGFAVAPKERAQDLRRAAEHAYFGLSRPLTDLIERLLTHPDTPRLAQEAVQIIGQYVRTAVNVLGSYDLVWREDVPFFWLPLPPGWRAAAFCQAAEATGVQIRSAEDFALRDARTPHSVRVTINAQVTLEAFEGAMLRLRDLLDHPPEHIGV